LQSAARRTCNGVKKLTARKLASITASWMPSSRVEDEGGGVAEVVVGIVTIHLLSFSPLCC